MDSTKLSPEVERLKTRLKAMWMAGNYDRCSRYMEGNAREFYERLNVAPGCQLLDVGCGSGKLALIAAKDGLQVTGVDIATNSVERARARAQAESLQARFEEADAEALPFEDESFDVVASFFGAMFAPRPDLAAKELLRVCAGRNHCHGQLDATGLSRPNLQNRRNIHCAIRNALTTSVGRRSDGP